MALGWMGLRWYINADEKGGLSRSWLNRRVGGWSLWISGVDGDVGKARAGVFNRAMVIARTLLVSILLIWCELRQQVYGEASGVKNLR